MRIYLISIFVLLSTLTGCSTSQKTAIDSIQILAENGANHNAATAIDIVFVYELSATGLLPRTAAEWFDKKSALMSGLSSSIDVVSLQVPPASIAKVQLPAGHKDAIGVYSFSNYKDAGGQPAGNLTGYKKIIIRLEPKQVVYSGS